MKLSSPTQSTTPLDAAHTDEVMQTTEMRTLDCPEERSKWNSVVVIIATGLLCLVPIVALIVSAFTAEPGSEPGEDGLASEGSSTMRAFTMGWMFCLAVKLRQEFVGLAGSSSFLEPW